MRPFKDEDEVHIANPALIRKHNLVERAKEHFNLVKPDNTEFDFHPHIPLELMMWVEFRQYGYTHERLRGFRHRVSQQA